MTSFEIFIDTIEKLSGSQGFYTRLHYLKEDMSQEIEATTTKSYKDSIDVIMDLEG